MTSPVLAILYVVGLAVGLVQGIVAKIRGLFRKVCVNPLCKRGPERRHKH